MNLVSFNVRGIESDLKQSRIKEVCNLNKVNFLGLQETMVGSISDNIVLYWGNMGFEFAF